MTSLKAGAELDRLVAEKVFDWKRGRRYANGNGEWHRPDGTTRTWDCTPRFSESIAHAMQVVEKLGESGWHVNISSGDTRTEKEWFVEFVGADERYLYTGEADSESLPEAICLAALAAVEEK